MILSPDDAVTISHLDAVMERGAVSNFAADVRFGRRVLRCAAKVYSFFLALRLQAERIHPA